MALIYSFYPRTTVQRGECGEFVRRLLARETLPKGLAARLREEVAPVLDGFATARSANNHAGRRATDAGAVFRTSSATLRAAIEGWMRSLDDAHDDDGYAEKNLRVYFDNQPISRLFLQGAHARVQILTDALDTIGVAPSLQGDPKKIAKVRVDLAACSAALNAYDNAVDARKGTVDALKASASAFDLTYGNLAARLVKDDEFARIVPTFSRGRGKVVDPELTVQPDPDKVEDPDPADTGTTEPTDAAPAPDAVEAPAADPVEETPNPE